MPKFRSTHTPVVTIARVRQTIHCRWIEEQSERCERQYAGRWTAVIQTHCSIKYEICRWRGQDTGGPPREFLRLAMLGLQDMHNSGMNVNNILQKWPFCSEISTTYKSFSQVNQHWCCSPCPGTLPWYVQEHCSRWRFRKIPTFPFNRQTSKLFKNQSSNICLNYGQTQFHVSKSIQILHWFVG